MPLISSIARKERRIDTLSQSIPQLLSPLSSDMLTSLLFDWITASVIQALYKVMELGEWSEPPLKLPITPQQPPPYPLLRTRQHLNLVALALAATGVALAALEGKVAAEELGLSCSIDCCGVLLGAGYGWIGLLNGCGFLLGWVDHDFDLFDQAVTPLALTLILNGSIQIPRRGTLVFIFITARRRAIIIRMLFQLIKLSSSFAFF